MRIFNCLFCVAKMKNRNCWVKKDCQVVPVPFFCSPHCSYKLFIQTIVQKAAIHPFLVWLSWLGMMWKILCFKSQAKVVHLANRGISKACRGLKSERSHLTRCRQDVPPHQGYHFALVLDPLLGLGLGAHNLLSCGFFKSKMSVF